MLQYIVENSPNRWSRPKSTKAADYFWDFDGHVLLCKGEIPASKKPTYEGSSIKQGFEHYILHLGDRNFIEEVDEVISNDNQLYLKLWKLRCGLRNWRKCRRIQYL